MVTAPSVDPATGAAFLRGVGAGLPSVTLLTEPLDLEAYRRDETAYLEPPPPLAVALPTTTAEVAGLVRLAAQYRVPIVPRGAGSGLSGGAVAVAGGLTISFMRMNRVLEIDRANLVVVTQPGVLNAALKRAVAAEGLFYAPDPASTEICSIGGNLGTNAGGLCCLKYGVTRDAVIGLEIVTAAGEIVRLGGKTTKDVAGYGLIPLIVGSQGTLALITEATLRLRPTPPPKATLLAFFPSLVAAGDAVSALAAAGLEPCTLELLDRTTIRAVDDDHNLGLDRDAAAMLMIESDLPGAAATRALEVAEAACLGAGAGSTIVAADQAEADLLRQARRLAFNSMERLGVARMEDVGVPRGRVPELLAEIERIAADQGLLIATFGHVGDGNLHPNIILDREDPDGEAKLGRATDALYRAAIALGGTVTAEHGIGVARRDYLELQRGSGALAMMRAVKTALDPLGILNPGKVLPDA